jgi:hypothetical protein
LEKRAVPMKRAPDTNLVATKRVMKVALAKKAAHNSAAERMIRKVALANTWKIACSVVVSQRVLVLVVNRRESVVVMKMMVKRAATLSHILSGNNARISPFMRANESLNSVI